MKRNDLENNKATSSLELQDEEKLLKEQKKYAKEFAKRMESIREFFNIKEKVDKDELLSLMKLLKTEKNDFSEEIKNLQTEKKWLQNLKKRINTQKQIESTATLDLDKIFKFDLEFENALKLIKNELNKYNIKEEQMKKKINIAIDGPSGVGKTVMSTMLAKKYDLTFISSGNIYRLIAYNAIKKGIKITEENLEKINNAWKFEDIVYKSDGKIFLKGKDVSSNIRENEISIASSKVSKYKPLREKVNKYIQEIAKNVGGIIVDGRDATYRILPEADFKFYLDARAEIRANRRINQDILAGRKPIEFNKILEDIKNRDYEDMNRKVDPLKVSEGSVYIDTSNLSVDENLQAIVDVIEGK
ncbi:cytidylate kinase [Metamycoplasma subdolum]|uniref:Cytidylate kinase n=1 Tax=Metamycoplasma subdolum TaxID=92407 RepID=A0A3L9ZYD0_9BACT|nr:(d)CMP kinase [Metamycoplasma subdolum]RMA77456.1 cytidylate kinase [Metamycoplasma subdolum]WPB50315.1 (d)CMP kinase [Metamycoplasma subdolum]